jgi:hypothetical protein
MHVEQDYSVCEVVWAAAGEHSFGYSLITPATTRAWLHLIVVRRGGSPAKALGVHGLTAVLVIAAGALALT